MDTKETGATCHVRSDRGESIISWSLTILACFYFLFICGSLYRSTAVFINMYNSMSVELHYPTLFVITAYRWLYPLLFAGAAIFVVAKQFWLRGMWASVAITLAVTVAMDLVSGAIIRVLYSPLFDLIEKLSK